jgi:glycerol-3-phosphate O-acyltransferase / dihydroxyacetone phosphate acyltransferase
MDNRRIPDDPMKGMTLDSQIPIHVRPHGVPAAYRLMRVVVRFGLRLFFPRLRMLNLERVERPGPAILLITHPRSLPVALFLISALDRPVHCLVPSGEVRGIIRRVAARGLGIQAFDCTRKEQNSRLNSCLSVLANQGMLALFGGQNPQDRSQRPLVADFAARLTVEAILQSQGQIQSGIYPVHWFLGTGRRGPEPLMCVDNPIEAKDFLPKVGEDVAKASQHLVEAVRSAIGANIFGLAEADLEHFNQQMEDLSREHLRQQWSRRPGWKQRPEDLEFSSFARKWIAEQNRTDPARLVQLRESLDSYREAHRRCSLGELIVETSGPWQASQPRVVAAWIETVLGFPVALYGLINHFLAVIILSVSGLFGNSPKRDPKVEWLLRIFAVLSSYTLQIFVVHFWWGRAVAGYYALTLPVSGAYLWRYRWLIRRRVRVLVRKALHPARLSRVARARDAILRRFNQELESSAQSSAAPNLRSHGLAE